MGQSANQKIKLNKETLDSLALQRLRGGKPGEATAPQEPTTGILPCAASIKGRNCRQPFIK